MQPRFNEVPSDWGNLIGLFAYRAEDSLALYRKPDKAVLLKNNQTFRYIEVLLLPRRSFLYFNFFFHFIFSTVNLRKSGYFKFRRTGRALIRGGCLFLGTVYTDAVCMCNRMVKD